LFQKTRSSFLQGTFKNFLKEKKYLGYVLTNHIKNIFPRSFIPPFLLALGGVFLDYMSTSIGLTMGLYEINPQYHPVWALLYFWGVMVMFALFMPRRKIRVLSLYGLAAVSYFGVLNNTLVMLGLFHGF
jgi:hypothetical protein